MKLAAPRRWVLLTSLLFFAVACVLMFRPDAAPQFDHLADNSLLVGYLILLTGVLLR